MARRLFFYLGLANSILLILIFIIRGQHLDFIKSYGWIYLLLAIPAIYDFYLVRTDQKVTQYRIFLGIFLFYLVVEGMLDFVLKTDFRSNWSVLGPYIALYYVVNYGFTVLPWKESRKKGILMLVLFVLQLLANFTTH